MRPIKLSAIVVCLLASGCGSSDESDDSSKSGSAGTVELGEPCIVRADCKNPLAECKCDGEGYGETKCIAVPAGTACNGSSECGLDTRCIDGTCQPFLSKGASCGESGGPDCAAGSTCHDDVCGPAGIAGEHCGVNEPGPCAAGLYCKDSKCVASHLENEACDEPDSCLDDSVCATVGAPAKCYPRRKAGESCVTVQQCPDNFKCNGMCVKTESPKTCF